MQAAPRRRCERTNFQEITILPLEPRFRTAAFKLHEPPGCVKASGLELIIGCLADDRGRTTPELGPDPAVDLNWINTMIRWARWTVQRDFLQEVWTADGYAR